MFEHLDDTEPVRVGDETRESVMGRGRRLIAHRRALAGGLGLAVIMAATLPLLLSGSKSTPRSLRTLEGAATTSTADISGPTSTALQPAGQSPPAQQRPTTTLLCRNSTNPACGPFRWDPDPGPNAPLVLTITPSPASPHVGDEVSFHLTEDDADAEMHCDAPAVQFGDGSIFPAATSCMGLLDTARPHVVRAFGPWTPPPRIPGHLDLTITHTYGLAGTYIVTFPAQTTPSNGYSGYWGDGSWPADSGENWIDPYASSATITATITVLPAAGGSTTTSTTAGG